MNCGNCIGAARLILTISLWLFSGASINGQEHAAFGVLPVRQKREMPSREEGRIRRHTEEERQFLGRFLQLAPEERVRIWGERKDITGRGLAQIAMDDALIALGTDAAPYLCQILRNGNPSHRIYAAKLLCDMDRFVALRELPLPDIADSVYVESVSLGGRLNQFMPIDGRRIGKDASDAVKLAAEQTRDMNLGFHARLYSGRLKQDLERLPLDEQLRRWRRDVITTKGVLSFDARAAHSAHELRTILIEEAPDSVEPLIDLLKNESNGYVLEEGVAVLGLIDSFRMRLRATVVGKKAIETIHSVLMKGGLKPVYTTPEKRESLWKELSARIFKDEIPLDNSSDWAIFAMALEKFHGVKVTSRYYTVQMVIKAAPEIRRFLTFLTDVDPYFPSWEYTFSGPLAADQVLHPRFKEKVARYYEQWLRFTSKTPARKPGD